MCGAHSTVRGLLKEIPSDDGVVIVDLEASPEHMTRSTTRHVDVMLVVAEPYFKSLETARRYHDLASDLGIPTVGVVGNKLPPGEDDLVAVFCQKRGFEVIGSVPYDPAFIEAEHAGEAPVDASATGPGVEAVRRLAERLTA